jgi:SAM-dependent methyltransferase
MSYDRTLDSKVTAVFNTNESYYKIMQAWHEQHDGIAVEADVKRLIEGECRPGCRILEAGSGAGNITNWFAKRYPLVKFDGVDISRIGISMASQHAPENAKFLVGDLKKLSFDDGSFDFVFSQSVIEHVVGWEEALAELNRVLVPGGKLLIRVENAGVGDHISRYRSLLNYLLCRNRTRYAMPSFELRPDSLADHEANFDVQGIPSDVLLKSMRRRGFSIRYFTTGTHLWRKSDDIRSIVVSYLHFFPFNHLGATTIVLGEKRRNT